MAKDTKQKVDIVFSRSPEYRMLAANGVWGGVTSRRDFKLEFIVDSPSLPGSTTHEVTKKGMLTDEISRKPAKKSISREIQGGVLLSLEQAESVAHFILEHIKRFREQEKP